MLAPVGVDPTPAPHIRCRPGLEPGPICGRPPWHKNFVEVRSDRLHPYVRPLGAACWTAGQDGFRDTSSKHSSDLFGQWVPRICSRLGSIDRTISSALAAPVRPVGSPSGRPNFSVTSHRSAMRRRTRRPPLGERAGRHRRSLPSSSASTRCAPSCWQAPPRQAWPTCASTARGASQVLALSPWRP